MTLSECVNAWLLHTGIKQKAVAERAGMAPSKVSELVTGANADPQFSTVEKLAKGFGVDVVEFLAGPRQHRGTGDDGERKGRVLSEFAQQLLSDLDQEAPASEDWRGDVLKAIAALNRALRRPDQKSDAA